MKIISISKNKFNEQNAYIIKDDNGVSLIDPGFNYLAIVETLEKEKISLDRIILTHGHIDHFGECDKLIKKYGHMPIFIMKEDLPLLFDPNLSCSRLFGMDVVLKSKKDIVNLEDMETLGDFQFIKTPGHTEGSMVIKYKNYLFTGDTLFNGSIGRYDLYTGSEEKLYESLDRIVKLFAKKTFILPGHGKTSTLKDELKYNLYLQKRRIK